MSTQIERLIVEMQAKLDKYDRDIRSSMDKTGRESRKGAKALKSVEKQAVSLNTIGSTAIKAFGAAAAVYISVASIRALGDYADAFTSLENKIKTVLKPTEDLATTTDKLLSIANDTRSSLDATVTLYSRLTRNTKELGLSQAELFEITETINKSFAVSGATVTEANAAITQLSQGLASGALRGDEFNSVAEQAPVIMEAVAAQLKVTRGELRAMAAEGQITSEILIKSLKNYKKTIDSDFAKSTRTISQATTGLSDNFTVLVGNLDKATGASNLLVTAIGAISSNMHDLNKSLDDDINTVGEIDKAWTKLGGVIRIAMLALGGLADSKGLDTFASKMDAARMEMDALNFTLMQQRTNTERVEKATTSAVTAFGRMGVALRRLSNSTGPAGDAYRNVTNEVAALLAEAEKDPSLKGVQALQTKVGALLEKLTKLSDGTYNVEVGTRIKDDIEVAPILAKLKGLVDKNVAIGVDVNLSEDPELQSLLSRVATLSNDESVVDVGTKLLKNSEIDGFFNLIAELTAEPVNIRFTTQMEGGLDLSGQISELESLLDTIDLAVGKAGGIDLNAKDAEAIFSVFPNESVLQEQADTFKAQFDEILSGGILENENGFMLWDEESIRENGERTLEIIEEQIDYVLAQKERLRDMSDRALDSAMAKDKKSADSELKNKIKLIDGEEKLKKSRISTAKTSIALLSQFAGSSKSAAIALFAVQQGLAAAEVVVMTKAAGMRAMAELGPILGPPAVASIEAMGAVSLGTIAGATALGAASIGLSGGGGGGGGQSDFGSSTPSLSITQQEDRERADFDASISSETGGQTSGITIIAEPGSSIEPLFEILNEAIKNGRIQGI